MSGLILFHRKRLLRLHPHHNYIPTKRRGRGIFKRILLTFLPWIIASATSSMHGPTSSRFGHVNRICMQRTCPCMGMVSQISQNYVVTHHPFIRSLSSSRYESLHITSSSFESFLFSFHHAFRSLLIRWEGEKNRKGDQKHRGFFLSFFLCLLLVKRIPQRWICLWIW